MLYRTYRPQKFSELVGLEAVKKTLQRQVKEGKIGHAYLFAGPRGTGKTTTARILARAINCKSPKDGEPDGRCQNCRQIQEGRYIDLIEIDAASNRGIDDIRSLREKVRLAPSVGQFKVYIVDEAHMLTPEAFNALLKTLEEPPAHAIFILATTEPHKLPDTIRSRCQRFNFERAPVALIVERLKGIVKKEKAEISEEELEEIAKAAGGGFRDAETLLEQVLTGGEKVEELIGWARLSDLGVFLDHLIAGESSKALSFVNDLYDKGVPMENLTQRILEYLRDLLLIKAGVGDELVEVTREQDEIMKRQAQELASGRLNGMINKFTQAYEYLAQAAVPTLPLEVAVVEVSSPPRVDSSEEPRDGKAGGGGKREEIKRSGSQPAETPKNWIEFVAAVKPLNHSVEALLRSCTPRGIKGRSFIIQAFYPFHKERLEESRNRTILEKALKQVYGRKLSVKVELASSKK